MSIGLRALSDVPAIRVELPQGGRVTDTQTGALLGRVAPRATIQVNAGTAGEVRLGGPGISVSRPDIILSGRHPRAAGRVYPGRLRFRISAAGLLVTNELDIEEYLEGVLPGELPPYFRPESQKALAVAARSYALAQRGKHGLFDLCDGTHCQKYLGYTRASARGLAAVRATRRLCLWSGNAPAYAFYSADCGGVTADVRDVPLPDKPTAPLSYLRSFRDAPKAFGGRDYCAASRYHRWTARLDQSEVEERLVTEPETTIARLTRMEILGYDRSGRVATARLTGMDRRTAGAPGSSIFNWIPVNRTVTGWSLRRALGPLTIKSTRFAVDQPEAGVYRFSGSGFGHGVGLCQIGANGMARSGASFRRILAHYYPGTRLAAVPRN